ncbi:hypothetical protein ILUMI_19541, partial [Ignelater luminosus]
RSIQIKLRYTVFFVTLALQLSFYCIPANYIAEEGLAVARALYSSKWYSHHFPSLKVPLLLMTQNAQRGITIKAGGLVAINTETFVNVLKVAWHPTSDESFYIFPDPSHMVRLVRNRFREKDLIITDDDGSEICWQYREQLYDLQDK